MNLKTLEKHFPPKYEIYPNSEVENYIEKGIRLDYYNQARQDCIYALPKILEEIRKEIENMEEYSLGDDSANVGYYQCKNDVLSLLSQDKEETL